VWISSGRTIANCDVGRKNFLRTCVAKRKGAGHAAARPGSVRAGRDDWWVPADRWAAATHRLWRGALLVGCRWVRDQAAHDGAQELTQECAISKVVKGIGSQNY